MKRVMLVGLFALITVLALVAQDYTRGVGVYPGDPKQDSAPSLVNDTATYRNLALHRAAYQSSAYDYNLTAQLVTDGLKETKLPRFLVATTSSGGVIPKTNREFMLDHNTLAGQSSAAVSGPSPWIQFEFAGDPFEIDRIDLDARPGGGLGRGGAAAPGAAGAQAAAGGQRATTPPANAQPAAQPAAQQPPGEWTVIVSGSDDGQGWKELGRANGTLPTAGAGGFGGVIIGGLPGAAPSTAGGAAAGAATPAGARAGTAGAPGAPAAGTPGQGPGGGGGRGQASATPPPYTGIGVPASQMPPPQAGGGFGGGGFGRGGGMRPSVAFSQPARYRFYRIALNSSTNSPWTVAEASFFSENKRVEVAGPHNFNSAWKPEGQGAEWVYVDLGAKCTFDDVKLFWIRRAAEGALQVSDDAKSWKDIQPLPAGSGLNDDIKLAKSVQGRYVRLLLKKPAAPDGYILSELEVYGRGGPVAKAKAAPLPRADGRLDLTGGAWRLQRDSLASGSSKDLSTAGFKDADWMIATVPATVLCSYWYAGALPDPDYGENQLAISDSFFYADFWYRNEFVAPQVAPGRKVFLNFDGINWKADVYFNGEKLGRIEGAFMRGKFDITGKVRPGVKNALAVKIEKNATPGSVKQKTFETTQHNGGALGADNPTYHAVIGWDWIPTVRGRDIGIWNDVYLTQSGAVTIENPYVSTKLPLPDTSTADVRVEVSLNNHDSKPVSGTLRGRFGDVAFEKAVTLDPSSAKTVVLDPSTNPALRLTKPRLWWPNGYGDQNLYKFDLKFETAGQVSDEKSFQTGVREFTYTEEGNTLRIWINGRRFVGKGGNWGHPETNLRYRNREYDTAVHYHKDMNFTMIRNWVGQTGDEEFYDACDRWGIVVWQDFWLANPVDGPNPDDNDLFLRNAKDFIQLIRNHPSIGLYVGRNEGNPPQALDQGIRKHIREVHPDIYYISSSAGGGVSGGGPYAANTPRFYFQSRATPKLHSELGMPNVVTLDSLKQMMPESDLWPLGALSYGLHDFTMQGAQRLSGFRTMLDNTYGPADNIKDWIALAQFINYDGYRGIFEAQSKNRMGVLLWMSHPTQPSFVWQTYDWYFDQPGGYWGSKKGSEPLHIQWNPTNDTIEVVNYSAGNQTGLTAHAEILNMDGSRKWEKTASVDINEDNVLAPIKLEFPSDLTPVHFIRLKLTKGNRAISDNFYLRGLEEYNFKAIRNLPKVKLEATTKAVQQGSRWVLTTELRNASKDPALMVRVKVVRAKSGDRILPVYYNDNYVALMPGETRTIRTELANADTRGEAPKIAIEGFNTGEVVVKAAPPAADRATPAAAGKTPAAPAAKKQ